MRSSARSCCWSSSDSSGADPAASALFGASVVQLQTLHRRAHAHADQAREICAGNVLLPPSNSRLRPQGGYAALHNVGTSALIPKFVSTCGKLGYEPRNQRGTSNFMILVSL